jgi:Holliday junction resolvase RusA-like endonuclease
MIKFTVIGDPKALKRVRVFTNKHTGKKHGVDPSAEDKETFLQQAIKFRPTMPLDIPLRVDLKLYFSRPKSHYRTGKYSDQLKPNAPVYHTVKRYDVDNVIKFILDTLNGIFWKDDCFVCVITAIKKYSLNPRTEIKITEL